MKMESVELSEIDTYNMGTRRTIAQFWSFCGLDPSEKTGIVWSPKIYEEGGFNRIPWFSEDPLGQQVFAGNEKYRTKTEPH